MDLRRATGVCPFFFDLNVNANNRSVPAGAAHVAFPAPSRDAVSAFFIAALKAGGKIHGEPCLRDAEQSYYSAAVIDFDGNSIEAVHRPGSSRSKMRAGDRALTAIENGSVVSKASSVKSRSTVRGNSTPSEIGSFVKAPSSVGHRSIHDFDTQSQTKPTISPMPAATQLQVPPKDNGLTGAKAVVGTLIGAAAGAAAAYAMFKSESQSEAPPKYSEASPTAPSTAQSQGMPEYRAIEAAPMSDYARSTLSKNPKASTIFEGLEQASRILGGAAQSMRGGSIVDEPQHYPEPRRHSTATGSIVYDAGSEMNLPIRAIEGIPDGMSEYNRMYPCTPSTFISSFVDKPRRRESDGASVYSASTVKPSKRPPSSRHSQSARSVVTISDIGSYHSHRSRDATPTQSVVYSSTQSARNVPLPSSVNGSTTSRRHSIAPSSHHSSTSRRSRRDDASEYGPPPSSFSAAQSIKSYRSASAHDIPLPASVMDGTSTIYFDEVDFNPGDNASRASRKSKATTATHRSSRQRSQSRSSTGRSRRSSKFDEPVMPSDSVSQVSTNVSKRSHRSRRSER